MTYAGVDYSINCPCVCIYEEERGVFNHENSLYFFQQNNVSKKEMERRNSLVLQNIFPSEQYKWENDYSRFFGLADYLFSILLQYSVEIIAIENFSLGSNGKIFNIAEATSIFKNLCLLSGMKLYAIPPTTTKKIFSGKGNADKQKMIDAYNEKYNVNIFKIYGKETTDSPLSDIVDSHAQLFAYFNLEEKEQFRLF